MIVSIFLTLILATIFFVAFLIDKINDLTSLIFECFILIFHTISFIFWQDGKIQLINRQNVQFFDLIKNLQNLNQLLHIIKIYRNYELKAIGKRKIIKKLDNKNSENQLILGEYEWLTYKEVFIQINDLIKILFYKFNLKRSNRVVIMAETCQQFLITFLALQYLGIEVVIINTKSDDEIIREILNSVQVDYLFTQSDLIDKLDRFYMLNQSKKSGVHKEIKLIIYENSYVNQPIEVKSNFEKYNYDDLFEESKELPELELNNFQKVMADDIAVISFDKCNYTKGIKLTHSNLIESIKIYIGYIAFEFNMNNNDTVLAYLPVSYIFELIVELVFFALGIKLAYAKPSTLFKESKLLTKSKSDLQASDATILVSVPLILERIKKQIKLNLKSQSSFLDNFYNILLEYKRIWCKYGYECGLTDLIFFHPIKNELNNKLKHVLVSGPFLSIDTQIFIKLYLNVQLSIVYASTESLLCSIATYDCTNHSNKFFLFNDIEFKIEDWKECGYSSNDKPNPRGELIIGSKSVSIGYFNNEEETKACFFEENGLRWFKSGDIVEINENNYYQIKIIDCKRDFCKLQNGSCILLSKLEKIFKTCSFIKNLVLYSNPFNDYLIAIIEPIKDNILTVAKKIKKCETNSILLYEDECIKTYILNAIKKHAKLNYLTSREIPVAIKLCTEDWQLNSFIEESSKPKRSQIYSFYKESIDKMYLELDLKYSIK